MLKIGQIEYANCTPLFHALRKEFACEGYEFVSGVPAILNGMLKSGGIDVCPSSSIEYAYHPDKYKILPHLSISSIGPVASVLLFSRVPADELDGCRVLLSSESATSVNLLKILLGQHIGCVCEYAVALPGAPLFDDKSAASLLIGDRALKASFDDTGLFVYDLGEMWYSWTGCPFVFALWLCRREIADGIEIKVLSEQLIRARSLADSYLEEIVAGENKPGWIGHDHLLDYWRDNISYDLDEPALDGLRLFYAKCFEGGLISAVPALHFATL